MNYCSISEAAAKFNLPQSTLRYYEKKGLLPFIQRDEADRRLFSDYQMALFEIVLCLKNTNMPISSIKQYMDWVIEGDPTVEKRLEMMMQHKQTVLNEISLMTESLKGIDFKIERYTKQIQERKQDEY
ncbi:MerR family transcriptional regulator [Paenibacillus sp. BSR1-1]|uniref:MerR family transcriptional regulator n=1 Tax=Paenibacillus sp. BSR1-1 TaxID=3020845 RepID=UPI0025AEF365|nr:MerR family transcriptional regulator [Paenibacillus sp. BSR1-1]MDN3015700.1 MerR family transcriptional regulator [Paenibacillus sp. BSR1-1]